MRETLPVAALQTAGTTAVAANSNRAVQPFAPYLAAAQPDKRRTLLAQTERAAQALAGVDQKLQTPGLQLHSAQQEVLERQLASVHGHLQAVHGKLTGDHTATSNNPLYTLFDYLSDGLQQFEAVKKHLAALCKKEIDLSPVDFMWIQLEINKAQQEIEFTTLLLSKATDAIRTLFNVQL